MNTLRFIVNTPTRRHGHLVNSWTLGRALTRADSRPRGGGGGHSLQMLHILLFVNVSQNLSLCQIQRYIGINLHKTCVRVLAVCRRAEEPRQYPGQCRLYIGTQISKVTPRTTHHPPLHKQTINRRCCKITEKAPTREATTTFTFKNLSIANRSLTPKYK